MRTPASADVRPLSTDTRLSDGFSGQTVLCSKRHGAGKLRPPMSPIDYSASAEVYANSRGGPKKSLFYRKFPSVAEALQFVVEGLPPGSTSTTPVSLLRA